MIFENTKELLHFTERTVLDIKHIKRKSPKLVDDIIQHNILGFIDVKDNFCIISRTLIIAIILWGAVSLLSGFAKTQMFVNGVFAFVIAMIFSSFAMPSNITGSEIKLIHDKIKSKKLTSLQIQARFYQYGYFDNFFIS